MKKAGPELSRDMTVAQFENGYWYAEELRAFARELGVPSTSRLRKDELEQAILLFLEHGVLRSPARRSLKSAGTRDSALGLRLDLPVVNYKNDPETKAFLLDEARKVDPEFRIKSGTRYLLNRWREKQLGSGVALTYGDLVAELMRLAEEHEGPLRTTHGRYNNFISDFMADRAGNLKQAIDAWNELKEMDAPKTYAAWKESRKSEP